MICSYCYGYFFFKLHINLSLLIGLYLMLALHTRLELRSIASGGLCLARHCQHQNQIELTYGQLCQPRQETRCIPILRLSFVMKEQRVLSVTSD